MWCKKFSHAMAEEFGCCSYMMDKMVLCQAGFCGIWSGQCGCGTGLCLRVYPYYYYSSHLPYIYNIHLPLTLYNVSHFGWCSIIHFSLSLDMKALINYVMELCVISGNNFTFTIPSLHKKRKQYVGQAGLLLCLSLWFLVT